MCAIIINVFYSRFNNKHDKTKNVQVAKLTSFHLVCYICTNCTFYLYVESIFILRRQIGHQVTMGKNIDLWLIFLSKQMVQPAYCSYNYSTHSDPIWSVGGAKTIGQIILLILIAQKGPNNIETIKPDFWGQNHPLIINKKEFQ